MAFGLRSSMSSSSKMFCLVGVVALAVLHVCVEARPSNKGESHDDVLSDDWQEEVDWMTPSVDTDTRDSWRAFPPSKIKSTDQWWHGTLDDTLWDSSLYIDDPIQQENKEETFSKDENEPATYSGDVAEVTKTDEQPSVENDDKKGEDDLYNVNNAPGTVGLEDNVSNEDNTESDTAFVPVGELDSFLDQDTRPYFGADLKKDTWPSNVPVKPFIQDSISGIDSDKKASNTQKDVPSIASNVQEENADLSTNKDITDEVKILDQPVEIEELADKLGSTDKTKEDESEKIENIGGIQEESDFQKTSGAHDADLQSTVEALGSLIGENIEEISDNVQSIPDADSSKDISQDLKEDVDLLIPNKAKRGDAANKINANTESEQTEEIDDVLAESEDVKTKSLGDNKEDELDGSKSSLQDWNQDHTAQKDEATPNGDKFEDWADWDDSVFDEKTLYDDNNDKEEKVSSDADTTKEFEKKKDGDDVTDAEDYLYYDDEDENEALHKSNEVNEAAEQVDEDDEDYEIEDEDEDDNDDDSEEDDEDEIDDEDDEEDDDDDDDDDDEEEDDDEDDDVENDYDESDEDNDEDHEESEESESNSDDDDDENEIDESNESDYDDKNDIDKVDTYADSHSSSDEDKDNVDEVGGKKPNMMNTKPKASEGQIADPSTAKKLVEDMDIDYLSLQPTGRSVAVDPNHYNKGIIYDSSHPFKKSKPSVKKDLNGPKSENEKGDDAKLVRSSGVETPRPKSDMLEKAIIKKFGPSDEKTSTGLESLTSPNPAPTVTSWMDTSQPSIPPSPSPSPSPSSGLWSSPGDLMMGDQPKMDSKMEESYVNSYPLERCHVDYECRNGRTCVDGVCKCFLASFCAGHYKPVCGSDGVQYPSHCELHRTSCLNRIRIRIDHSGKCFKTQTSKKEKSWLLEQERLLQEEKEKPEAQQKDNSEDIPATKIEQLPKDVHLDKESPKISTLQREEVHNENQKPESSPEEEKCTWNEMTKFKEDLLMYHCRKFVEPNCKLEVKTDRQYLSMLMFSYYDRNFDFFLTAEELKDKERAEHFNKSIVKNCHLQDFIKFADMDQQDSQLTVSEFTRSFEASKSSSVVNDNVEIVSTLASAGDGLELKCGVQASSVVWKRNGVQLEDDEENHKLMVFEDGALFFSKLSLHHIGNYTCMDSDDDRKAEVHRLSIQSTPVLQVTSPRDHVIEGSDVELHCHAEGVPKPTISWKHKGEDVLNSKHISVYYGYDHIVIHDAKAERDAGGYTCSAHSQAGTTERSVSVNIVPQGKLPVYSMRNEGAFLVFHGEGITVYDPLQCYIRHEVMGDFGNFKFIPDALDSPLTLCKKQNKCDWGKAVKVGPDFVYISQPDQNRVVIVEAGNYWNPLQIIDTDHSPEKLQYVPHLDQVWVLCRSQRNKESDKTIVVIRDASQHIQHRSVHTRPIGNHFDTVKDLFISPPNDLHHEFDHAYVTHAGKPSLSKINLEDMSYTEEIDLSMYACIPVNVAFVPLGGHVVIQCVSETNQHSVQLIMDYITSAIISTSSVYGRPLVSPDSRHLITVAESSGKVVVVSVSNEGQMETTYEVTVSASISDVSFIPSSRHRGYDLILTSADDNDLIIMNLVTGKVDKMPGSNQLDSSQNWHRSDMHRTIVAADPTSEFVMTPSKSSLTVINFKFQQVECEFTDLKGNYVMVHVPSPRTVS